jgi:hypothetical protein
MVNGQNSEVQATCFRKKQGQGCLLKQARGFACSSNFKHYRIGLFGATRSSSCTIKMINKT